MEERIFNIKENLLLKILNYLSTQPYNEVANLVMEITREVNKPAEKKEVIKEEIIDITNQQEKTTTKK